MIQKARANSPLGLVDSKELQNEPPVGWINTEDKNLPKLKKSYPKHEMDSRLKGVLAGLRKKQNARQILVHCVNSEDKDECLRDIIKIWNRGEPVENEPKRVFTFVEQYLLNMTTRATRLAVSKTWDLVKHDGVDMSNPKDVTKEITWLMVMYNIDPPDELWRQKLSPVDVLNCIYRILDMENIWDKQLKAIQNNNFDGVPYKTPKDFMDAFFVPLEENSWDWVKNHGYKSMCDEYNWLHDNTIDYVESVERLNVTRQRGRPFVDQSEERNHPLKMKKLANKCKSSVLSKEGGMVYEAGIIGGRSSDEAGKEAGGGAGKKAGEEAGEEAGKKAGEEAGIATGEETGDARGEETGDARGEEEEAGDEVGGESFRLTLDDGEEWGLDLSGLSGSDILSVPYGGFTWTF